MLPDIPQSLNLHCTNHTSMTTGNAWIQSVYQPLSHWVTQTHLVLLMPFQGCPLADVNGDGVEEFCGFQVRPSPQSTSQWHLVAYQGKSLPQSAFDAHLR